MGFFDKLTWWKNNRDGVQVWYPATDQHNPFLFTCGNHFNHLDTSTPQGQALAYLACPTLAAVINIKALAIKNAKLWAVDEEGNDANKPGLVAEMKNPNPYQDIHEFLSTVIVFTNVFGKCYIYKEQGVGTKKFNLYVIPNTIVLEKCDRIVDDPFQPYANISGYELSIYGRRFPIAREEMFIINDVNIDTECFFRSNSRLVSLVEPINLLLASFKTLDELMSNRGMLGIISLADKDIPNSVIDKNPMTKSQKGALQEQLMGYGSMPGQKRFLITNLAAAYTPVSANISDLGAAESNEEARKEICARMGISEVELRSSDSTYSNLNTSDKKLYTNTVQPEAENIMRGLNRIYGNEEYPVMPFFDHLEQFQEAKRQQASGLTNLINALNSGVNGGLIDINKAKELLENFLT